MKIGFRTLKTAIGVSLAVLIAQSMHLQYFSAAGILTLLCIQKSRKQSVHAAVSRLAACLLAFALSTVAFEAIGYHPYAFFIYLIAFIPLCVRAKIQEGLASSTVIVMHIYMQRQFSLPFLANELQVIIIGLGVALLVNWYMPSVDQDLARLKNEVDGLLESVLKHMAHFLREGSMDWNGKELVRLPQALEQARRLAVLDAENRPGQSTLVDYLEIKRVQFEILERMLPSISRMTIQLEQGARLGDYIEEMSACLSNHLYHVDLEERLRDIREQHKRLPMPETREEFENRASLFAVANELERLTATVRTLRRLAPSAP